MNAHPREQLADPLSAAICPQSDPLPVHRHVARGDALLSAVISPSRRRPGHRVPFDGAGVVQAILAVPGERPPSCSKEAAAGKRAGEVG
jgi:hypothetical protein